VSVSGIGSSSFFESNWQSGAKKVQQDFQQLGQDLQSGNLTAAQSDLATIENDAPNLAAAAELTPSSPASTSSSTPTTASSTSSSNPIVQAFEQLASDLQSGNLTAAQQDFSTLQQDVQAQAPQFHRHHHHRGESQSSESSSSNGNEQNGIVQTFQQLVKDLQSGNTSAAQQGYSSLEQDFQQFAQQQGLTTAGGGSSSTAPDASAASSISTTSSPSSPSTGAGSTSDSSAANSASNPYSISIQITEISISVSA